MLRNERFEFLEFRKLSLNELSGLQTPFLFGYGYIIANKKSRAIPGSSLNSFYSFLAIHPVVIPRYKAGESIQWVYL